MQNLSMNPRVRTLGDLLDHPFDEPEQLLSPWLTEKQLSMVYAPTGVGKSWFSLSIALAVAGGGSFLGWKAPSPQTVLLVDGEMNPGDVKRRASVILPGLNGNEAAANDNFYLYSRQDQEEMENFPDLATPEGQEEIMAIATERGTKVIILDNLSTLFVLEDENTAESAAVVIGLMGRIKHAGMSCILVHHSNKANTGQRGSSVLEIPLDVVIKLDREPSRLPGQTAIRVGFKKHRSEQDGSTDTFVALLRRHEDGQTRWKREESSAGPMSTREAILIEVVKAVRSCEYRSLDVLGEHFGHKKKWAHEAIEEAYQNGILGFTREEYKECMAEAKGRPAVAEVSDY